MANSLKSTALIDLDRELKVTRKVLERIPESHFAYKPHEKSMSLGRLAMHVATLPQWMRDTLAADELDLATVKPPRSEPASRDDLLQTFDEHVRAVNAALASIDDAALSRNWSLRRGDQVLHTAPRLLILRLWCLNHLIHHRAQLCVYLRLLNLPVPAVYFNSADEPAWTFD